MEAAYENNPALYTLAHELGHTVDSRMNDSNRGKVVGGFRRKFKDDTLWSQYGRKKPEEAYAEVFAQWLLGERTPVTEAFAERYGWYLSAEEYAKSGLEWVKGWSPPGGVGGRV
jgi:Zn-dependent peptidase ImmA (M78 family)